MASKLPVRLPTFDKRIIDDLALLVKLTADKLKPIAEVAVQLIVSKAGDGEIAELAGIVIRICFSMHFFVVSEVYLSPISQLVR